MNVCTTQIEAIAPTDFTAELGEAVVRDVILTTENQTLTSNELQTSVDIVAALVNLQEKGLAEGINITLSYSYTEVNKMSLRCLQFTFVI